jgi:hypothetical protein
MKAQSLAFIFAVTYLSGDAVAFEEIGAPAQPLDTTHVWKSPPVGYKYRGINNLTGKECVAEYIAVTDATRSIRAGSSTCVNSFPLYPFAPALKFEGCGRNGDWSGTQEVWPKGESSL